MKEGVRIKVEYRSSLRSKTLIRKALLDLLDEKPFDRITITDIVRKANINRGTFYLHFSDIHDVLHHIVIGVVDELVHELEKLDNDDIESSPILLFEAISAFLERDIDFYKKLARLDISGFVITEIKKKASSYIIDNFSAISPDAQNELKVATDCLIAGSASVYFDILSGDMDIALDKAPRYLGKLADMQMALYIEKKRSTEAIAE